MKRHSCGIFLILALCAVFAATWPFRGEWAEEAANGKMARPLARVRSWYFLQGSPHLERLARSPADLLVVGGARLGPALLASEDVARLKMKPDGSRRYVLAYLSVGSVDASRIHANEKSTGDPPLWLGEKICSSSERHRVRYWLSSWRNRNYRSADSELNRIIGLGFDGVYLDGIEIYRTYVKQRPSAPREMIDHVIDLARTARRRKPGFLVIVQNAEGLLADPDYRLAIDGIATESWPWVAATPAAPPGTSRGDIDPVRLLHRLQREGKPVFVANDLPARQCQLGL
jgi:cysteinyl-tRNA synthetase